MRKILYVFATILMFSCEPIEINSYNGESDISVMSFNIRYDEPADGNNQWSNRKEACITMFNQVLPSVFGIQEGLHNQVRFLDENLPQYSYVGVGRDDGYSGGEYAAIFYNNNQFELVDNGDFWLSETPNIPSLGWDANNIRICTWAKLKDVTKETMVYVFNTHFDHKGKTAQLNSSKLLVKKIGEIATVNALIFITGDFNMIIGNDKLKPIINNFYSAQRFANISDDNKSYNAFGFEIISRNIDFIFYNNAKALAYKTLVKNYGVEYISDHYPILTHFNYQ